MEIVETPISRKDQMFHVWLDKRLASEVAEMAEREAKASGHTTTATSLAKEILIWALDVYRKVGSLVALKKIDMTLAIRLQSKQDDGRAALYECVDTIWEQASHEKKEEIAAILLGAASFAKKRTANARASK